MIKKDTHYKLVLNGTVIASGNQKAMHALRKQTKGSRVFISFTANIGDNLS